MPNVSTYCHIDGGPFGLRKALKSTQSLTCIGAIPAYIVIPHGFERNFVDLGSDRKAAAVLLK